MQFLKKAYYNAVELFPIRLLQSAPAARLLLPYHHLVSDREVPHIKHLYPFKGTRAFEADLDYLLKNFKPVTVQQVIAAVNGKGPLPAKSFLITFDDGLREVADTIAPMLFKKGVPAVFFLNNAFLDNRSMFYKFKVSLMVEALKKNEYSQAVLNRAGELLREAQPAPVSPAGRGAIVTPASLQQAEVSKETLISAIKKITYTNRHLADDLAPVLNISFDNYLEQEKPFLSLSQVGQLVQQGFAIGGHSIDHPYYRELSLDEQVRQTLESVDFLAERFQPGYRVFAFPHSDEGISRRFFEQVLDGPGRLDLVFGTANQQEDMRPGILHRFNCERPAIPIQAAVKGMLLYNGLKHLTGKQLLLRH
jgi:peptidoglycan/xylan/chitin deacetylase (PgdA/CDA1 family)